ncbi:MAG: tRNA pseudouridine(55) synthase TruB [Coriobacteriia bacterium]
MTPRRRGATSLSGILVIDKPAGVTSHDVVNTVRRLTGEGRVGHAGTLDPAATGVLVVLVGAATRLTPYLTAAEKTYDAEITFGAETDTDDAEGQVTRTAPIPDELADPFFASATVAALVGEHTQVPPAYSAIKRDGQAAYKAARKGEEVTLEPRAFTISSASLLGVEVADTVSWTLRLTVSKGAYIRAIARDLGRALDTAAHLRNLRRVSSGAIDITTAVPLETLEPERVQDRFIDPFCALGLPVLELTAPQADRVRTGAALDLRGFDVAPGLPIGAPVALSYERTLLGVYARTGAGLGPLAVFSDGVKGTASCV